MESAELTGCESVTRFGKGAALASALLASFLFACGSADVVKDEGGEGGAGGGGGGSFDLRIPGMDGPADVAFDEAGILHVRCATDDDCLRVLGYHHASHRFFQMDVQRRAARGRLATLVPIQLSMDIEYRRLFSTSEGAPLEDEIWRLLSEEERRLLESYSEGVNAWLSDLRAGRNGARLSEEYSLPLVIGSPELIPDWEPLDTVAFVRLMTFLLSDSSTQELDFAKAFANLVAISPETALDFLTLRPGMKSYSIPAAQGPVAMTMPRDLSVIEALGERLARSSKLFEEARASLSLDELRWGPDFGSNNWVIAPSHTEGGKAILANDPHLALNNPALFYLVHLDATSQGNGTLHVAGATFPGTPIVVIGRNERVAWGATVAFYDVTDLYVEELVPGGDAVIFDGEQVPIIRKEFEFEVGGREEPVKETLEWVPHHGPVIAKDEKEGTALTMRWTGHEATNELRAFLELNRAKDVEEAKEALRSFEVGAQSFVLADVEGSVGLFPHARVPNRPWASFSFESPLDPSASLPPWMPLPGDGSAEWDGFVEEKDLPVIFDPPAGFVATANQDLLGATESGDPTSSGGPMLQNLPAPGLRMARIEEELRRGGTSHTVASSQALQMDSYSILGEIVVRHLQKAVEGETISNKAETLMGALTSWNFTCPTGLDGNRPDDPPSGDESVRAEARGCAAFHVLMPRLMSVAFAERFKASGLRSWNANLLVRPLIIGLERPEELEDPDAFWNDLGEERSKEEVLIAALERAGSDIAGPLGADPEGWLWGRIHTVTFRTELSAIAPELDIGPFAAPGGLLTVNVANPSLGTGGYTFAHGASLRIVSELGEEGVSTWLQLPGGRDLHRDGQHYGDLIEPWLEGRSFPVAFSWDEVEEAAEESLTVGP